jgi:hypothetical protein
MAAVALGAEAAQQQDFSTAGDFGADRARSSSIWRSLGEAAIPSGPTARYEVLAWAANVVAIIIAAITGNLLRILMILSFPAAIAVGFHCSELNTPGVAESLGQNLFLDSLAGLRPAL